LLESTMSPMPARILSMGMQLPMTPVLATSTSSGRMPSLTAVNSAIS